MQPVSAPCPAYWRTKQHVLALLRLGPGRPWIVAGKTVRGVVGVLTQFPLLLLESTLSLHLFFLVDQLSEAVFEVP